MNDKAWIQACEEIVGTSNQVCCGHGLHGNPNNPPECCGQPISDADRIIARARELDAQPQMAERSSVGELANFIRAIDGKHEMGAGQLAERIYDWLDAQPHAATSAGGEAVANDEIANHLVDELAKFRSVDSNLRRDIRMIFNGLRPLYLHPQPSTPGAVSDEDVAISIASELARIDGYDVQDANCGLFDVRWSGGAVQEPLGTGWEMDYLPKGERIARALESFAKRGVVAKPWEAFDDNLEAHTRPASQEETAAINAAIASPPAQVVSVPDGFVLVPKEPTHTMVAEGMRSLRCDLELGRRPQVNTALRASRNAYVTMLAASPAAATKEGE